MLPAMQHPDQPQNTCYLLSEPSLVLLSSVLNPGPAGSGCSGASDGPVPTLTLPLHSGFCGTRRHPLADRLLDLELVGAGFHQRCLATRVELAAASPYYVALAQFHTGKLPCRLELPAVGHTWLCLLLDALYDQSVTLSPANVAGFLAAASYLQVEPALRVGEAYLRDAVMPHFPREAIACAVALGLRRAVRGAGRLLRRQFLQLVERHGTGVVAECLALLPQAQARALFAAQDLQIPCEFALIELAVRLAASGAAPWSDAAAVKELLAHVRFGSMSAAELHLVSLFLRGTPGLCPELVLWLEQALSEASAARQQQQQQRQGEGLPAGEQAEPQQEWNASGRPSASGEAAAEASMESCAGESREGGGARTLPPRPSMLRTLSLLVDFAALGPSSSAGSPASSSSPSSSSRDGSGPGGSSSPSPPSLPCSPPSPPNPGGGGSSSSGTGSEPAPARRHLPLAAAGQPCTLQLVTLRPGGSPTHELILALGARPAPGQVKAHPIPRGFTCFFSALTAEGLLVAELPPLERALLPGKGVGQAGFLERQRGRGVGPGSDGGGAGGVEGGCVLFMATIP